jgi:hypothetical protein
MKLKSMFKKGDWVITPYNRYPVQLTKDSAFGIFDQLTTGLHFFSCSSEDAEKIKVTWTEAVWDSRDGFMSYEGFYPVEQVRKATKADMKLLVDLAKKDIKRAEKQLKIYNKAMAK